MDTSSIQGQAVDLYETLKRTGLELALNLAQALIIIFAGVILARLARRWLTSLLDRSRIKDDRLLKSFFIRSLYLTIIILASLTALSKIGWDVTTFVAGLGITGIILGFAFKDTLSNFAAGLLLLIYRPFSAGDVIQVEDSRGTVLDLTIVNMEMIGEDGVRVIMPNSKVWGAKILNFTLTERRRFEITVKLRQEDVEKAVDALKAALADDGRILITPPPSVDITAIQHNAVTVAIRAWSKPELYAATSSEAYIRVQQTLREKEIPIL
ncbi:MAG TPA: mechanosensitive ion channel family protein [Blastocatellia bacterium]|nr:mechanosensitive ion channel family protein [Blastocatellia bacterium]